MGVVPSRWLKGWGGGLGEFCNGSSANTFANQPRLAKNISPVREGQETAGIGGWKSGIFIKEVLSRVNITVSGPFGPVISTKTEISKIITFS